MYFHANKDEGAPTEDTLHVLRTAADISGRAHLRAGMPSVVTALCPGGPLCPLLPAAVKRLTGPAQGDSFSVTPSDRSHLWEVISVNCAVARDLGAMK